MQYVNIENYLSPELYERVEKDVITICKALGYDINTVEFAIKDGIPYAIDFMNPAPDAELASVGEFNHNWIVNAMTEFVIEKLSGEIALPEYRWSAMLNPPVTEKKKVVPKSKTAKNQKTEEKSAKLRKTTSSE
jgi:hypothetical protein